MVKRPAAHRRDSPKGWPTKELRLAVWERSEGRCENPACGRPITWSTFDLDHFVGRGKVVQLPENTWALCSWVYAVGSGSDPLCHQRKTAGDPSRLYWLEQFLKFARRRFAGSPTVLEVEGQLEAERIRAQLDEQLARKRAQEMAGG